MAQQFSYAQLEQLWINAGGSKATAPIAAAIAEAESGGRNINNYNDPKGDGNTQTSWGMWQVSNGTHGWPGAADPNQPANNAAYAVAKYKASGWAPWSTYNSGAYRQFLSNSVPPDPNVPAGGGSAVTTAATDAGTCVTGQVFGFCPLPKSEARAMIGGLCMVAGALVVLPGIIILVAAGFRGSGAAAVASKAAAPLEAVPGYGTAVRAARQRGERRRATEAGARGERQRRARAAGRAAERRRTADRESVTTAAPPPS